MLGPNVRRLIAHRAAQLTTDRAESPKFGGIASRILDGSFVADAKEAGVWVQNAIAAVRNAGEPNPWRMATDEEIAAELVARIERRLRAT